MRSTLRALAALGACGALADPAGVNAQAAQRQTRVEVMTPKAPAPVVTDGKTALVYELHVTNFDRQPLLIRSVEVFPERSSGRPVMTLRDSALRLAFQAVGAPMSSMQDAMSGPPNTPPRLNPGQRAVIFVWLSLDRNATVPTALRHRLAFDIIDSTDRPAEGLPSVIDGLVTSVARNAPRAFATPMRGGDWLAGEGPSNSSSHRRSLAALDGRARISQRLASDWVKVGPNGNSWHDDRTRNENFWGFGEPVLSVADAEVVTAVDSIDDNTPGRPLPSATVANIPGNHVILRLGRSTYVMYAHLKRGSVRVRPGQHIKRGEEIGLLGNSGQATAPHLHFQAMDAPSPLAAEGIPFTFERFTFLGLGQDYEPGKPHLSVEKRLELPIGDAVVHFPGGAER